MPALPVALDGVARLQPAKIPSVKFVRGVQLIQTREWDKPNLRINAPEPTVGNARHTGKAHSQGDNRYRRA